MASKESPTQRLKKIEQLRQCHIELEGNRELILDGCKGIMEYNDVLVKICTDTVIVSVTGDNLSICAYAQEQLVIKGKLIKIEFS